MKFAIIDPKAMKVESVDLKDMREAYSLAGLDPNRTDHGVLMALPDGGAIGFVVYEFGFYIPADQQHYFAVGPRLIAGNAVAYQVDRYGRTVSMTGATLARIIPTWFKSKGEVEIAIAAGAVPRPRLAVNDEPIWEWPNPAPPEMAERMASPTDLTVDERDLLSWMSSEEYSQYGECHGKALNALIARGFAKVHEEREYQDIAGFIARGDDPMFRAVSLTGAGKAAALAIRGKR